MATSVGSISYDVRLNLTQLKRDTAKAERMVQNSYKKMSKTPASGGGGARRANTQAEQITKTTKAHVESTRRAAQESYNSISKYTPQIQRQFLAVERANNQVYNASTRSATAIQKFGSGSVQATRATNSLGVAVKNQAMAQSRLDNSLDDTTQSMGNSRSAALALTGALIAMGAMITKNLGAGIQRLDTLNNFPKTMANFGLAAEDGAVAIEALSTELVGLPTSLDQGARAVQRFTAVNKDVKASTALFLAFNNAVIAGGAPLKLQRNALEQISQGYAKGRIDMIEWRSLLMAMPAQLNQVAESMEMTTDALGEGLRTGDVSVDDFLLTIARLNKDGIGELGTFREQAMNQVGGVQVTLTNLNTAIARSIEGMLSAIGTDELRTIIGGIADIFTNFGRGVSGAVNLVKTIGPAGVSAAAGVTLLTTAMVKTRNVAGLTTKAMVILRGAMTALSAHPIIGALTLLTGGLIAAGAAMGYFGDETDDTAESANKVEEALENYVPPLRGATDEAGKFAEQMAKIDEQIKEANEDYRYNLAQLVADKNENIASLQSTLKGEEKAYNNAYQERLASFNKTQNQEEKSHKDKVKELQNQIDFLTQYNTQANQQQVSELQFALAQENADYQESTKLRQKEFEAQTKSARDEYEKRRKENQKKLDEELALLKKHREDVLSVRNVMLRDEIENLKRSRDEQIKSLEQQRKQAASGGAAAGSAYGSNYKTELLESSKLTKEEAKKFYAGGTTGAFVQTYQRPDGSTEIVVVPEFSTGGFTGTGGENEPAGIVHKGEYVVPKENVNQSTGMPDFSKIGGTTVNVSLNMSGVMASGKSDMRQIANQMARLINETVTAKTGKPAIQGV